MNGPVNIVDTGPLGGGLNTLVINGATTASGQTFLLRDDFVAILDSNGAPVYQRVNYDGSITNRLEINGGDVTGALIAGGAPTSNGDGFYIDGNSALTTINAGNGNDFFQIGQIYDAAGLGAAAGDVGAGLGDGLETTLTTLGALSYGVEKATVLYGGSGSDTFQVYSNKADLSMIGGSGNDTFIVRAFLVAAGTHLNVKGGTGNDTIEYNINAPLDIEGGTGFNTLVLLGTEGADTFVVTQDGVFGGGLNVSYSNIQAVTIDTLEGDDTIYVESTPQNVVTTINAGAGSDKVIVGGDITQQVVANDTKGASSVSDVSVVSGDAGYNGIFVQGIPITVAGAGSAIISQPSQSVVHVGDSSSITSFTVSAPTALAAANVAYIDISPAEPSLEWASLGAAALQVSVDGGLTWAATGQLKFVGGQTGPQTVLLRAAAAPANDTYSRDETIVVASRVVSADQPELDALDLPSVKVVLRSGSNGLIIDQGVAPTTVLGGASSATQTSYTYSLSLNHALTGSQTVTVNLLDANAAADGVVLTEGGQVVSSVTFNASNWNVAQEISVTSSLTGLHGQIPVDIAQSIDGVDVGDVNLDVAATNTPGVLMLTPQGMAEVSPTQSYSYQIALTQAPSAPVTIDLLGDGQTIASSSASGFDPVHQTLTFTAANWNIPVTVTLTRNPNYTPPTAGGENSGTTSYLKFPAQPHTLAQINGPLVIDGATEAGQPSLVSALGLPYETNNTPVSEPTGGAGQSQSAGADILQVYADGSANNLTGSLTTISEGNLFAGVGDNLSGIGMPASNQTLTFTNSVSGVTTQFEGGIDFVNLDAVQVFLGSGDDAFAIDTTAATINATDNQSTLISVEGGGGSNTIDVVASSDPLALYGAASPTGAEYNSTSAAITGNAYSFGNFGADTIDASGATGTVVIVGGPMNDRLTGGSGVNWIFGGGGDDTITAAGAANYIFGDSSATVGALVSAAIQPATNPSAETIDLSSRLLTIYNTGAAAGDDAISVTGVGSSVVIGDYGVVDIVGQAAGVVDPFSSLGAEVITTIMSVNTSTGGDDTINIGNNDVVIGGAGADHIVVGPVGADVIIGDNGEADYVNGVLVAVQSIDPLHGGADYISGPIVDGQPTPAGSGGSVIIGGVGADSILLGGSGNTVIGDDGRVAFASAGIIATIQTLDPSFGGADIITVSGGDDTVIGGFGADQVTLDGGNDVVLGDNGFANFVADGLLSYITTTDQTFGGDDRILINGDGGDTIFGGSGADAITVSGVGGNIVFGDNGEAYFNDGALTRAETVGEVTAATGSSASVESATSGTVYGGNDAISVGSGANVIIGGLGADAISTGAGNNVVLGDSGAASFDGKGDLASIVSTFGGAPVGTTTSSNDSIILGSGANVVVGGAGADNIVVGPVGANVIMGDDGQAQFNDGVLTSITSTDGALGYGGADIISGPIANGEPSFGGSGGNIVFGGVGADTILLGGANNTIVGDDGRATFSPAGVLMTIMTIDPEIGGNDIIDVSSGNNTVIGGYGADQIAMGGGGNVVLGDNGYANFIAGGLAYITTTDQTIGGQDTITVDGGGGNVIFGGSAADAITVVGNGGNVVFGDNGDAYFSNGVLGKVETTGEVAAATDMAASVESATSGSIYGGDDTIKVGDGNNVIVGGLGADQITAGDGANVILGDSGTIVFNATGQLASVVSTFGGAGGKETSSNDAIDAGAGANVIVGGAGDDSITVGAGADVILGDDGRINYVDGALSLVYSTDGAAGYGGDDTITGPVVNGVRTPGGSGDSVVIGGIGSDTILIGGANNVVIGDDGRANYAANGQLLNTQTTDAGIGAADAITLTGASNVVFGGAGGDAITLLTLPGAPAPTGNVVAGDDGSATFTNAILTQLFTTNPTIDKGGDLITAGDGNNIVIGGSGADQIVLGDGSNVVLGDNAEVDFSSAGVLTTVKSAYATLGGEDTIVVGSAGTTTKGRNIVFGGAAADTITINGDGANIVLGDNGEADFINGNLGAVYSTVTSIGGNDTIGVNGSGANVVIGGVGADQIVIPGAGDNVVFGDNAYVDFSGGYIAQAYTIAPLAAGGGTIDTGVSNEDAIVVGDGANTIFGGAGADSINAGDGANMILGDFGQAVWTAGVITTLTSTDTSLGGDDTIKAGDGANVVFGGIGANQINLGDGANAVVGGDGFAQFGAAGMLQAIDSLAPVASFGGTADTGTSNNNMINVGNGANVVIGGGGADRITAGDGNNYLIGDNGEVQYIVVDGADIVSRAQSTFQLFGGNDAITAGDGTNSIIGGVGSDVITAGNGIDNLLLGDNGEIVQAFTPEGALVRNADGALHRDIVTQEIAQIIGSALLDSSNDVGVASASAIVGANLVMLAGAFNADGTQVILPADSTRKVAAWEVDALLLSLSADGNDILTSGSGSGSVLIGQGGDNTLTAKGGSDYLFGNYASNTSPFASDIPFIVNAYVIAASPGDAAIAAQLPAGGLIVAPSMNLQPTALTYENPQLLTPPPGFGTLSGLAEGADILIGGGQKLQVYASIVPSALNGSPGLPGSNTINGGSGDDVIFGNFGQIGALYSTGISELDQEMTTLSSAMMGVLANFSALSTAQYMLDAVNAGSTSTAAITYANNVINVGSGHNLVFGNAGFYVEPNTSFARSATGSITADAVNFETFMLDMEEVAADTSQALRQLGAGVLTSFAATTAGQTAEHGNWWSNHSSPSAWWCDNSPGVANLEIGDNTINATAGGDNIIIGNVGYVIMPSVDATTNSWANGLSRQAASSLDRTLNDLQWSFNVSLQKELCYDFSYDTRVFNLTDPLFEYRGGIQVTIGNDVIESAGGSGANIVIGDSAILVNIVTGSDAINERFESVSNVNSITSTLLDCADSIVNSVAREWGLDSNTRALQGASLFSGGNFIFTGDDSKLKIDTDTITVRCDVDLAYAGSADLTENGPLDWRKPANFFGYTNSNPAGPAFPFEGKFNEGVSGGLFFARLGRSTIINGPDLVNLLAAGMTACPPGLTLQVATVIAQVPVALEYLPAMAASPTGALSTYYNAALFPPLDPILPQAVASSTAKAFVTIAASGGVVAVKLSVADGESDASLVTDGSGSGPTSTNLASFDEPDAVADDGDYRLDSSSPFGFDGERPVGRSSEAIRAFIDSEIVIRTTAEAGAELQSWVLDEGTGVLTLHESRGVAVERRASVGIDKPARAEPAALSAELVDSGLFGAMRRIGGAAARWFDA